MNLVHEEVRLRRFTYMAHSDIEYLDADDLLREAMKAHLFLKQFLEAGAFRGNESHEPHMAPCFYSPTSSPLDHSGRRKGSLAALRR
jgi:hypothetical protein